MSLVYCVVGSLALQSMEETMWTEFVGTDLTKGEKLVRSEWE